jgi:hypothetical protein
MTMKQLAVMVGTLVLAIGISTPPPMPTLATHPGSDAPMKTLNALIAEEIGRQHPDWKYVNFVASDDSVLSMIDAAVISADRRIELGIYRRASDNTARSGLAQVRGASPEVRWVSIDGVGEECFGYDECDQAWVYLRRCSMEVEIYGRRNAPPAEGELYYGPGKGCRSGHTEFSIALWGLATALAPVIDTQLAAAELAVAPEPAQPSAQR